MRREVTAAILTGGKGLRMGGVDKQGILIGGQAIGRRVATSMLSFFDEVLVVGKASELYSDLPVRQVADLSPGFGPLSGLQAALASSRREWLYLVACDMPYFSEPWLEYMWEKRTDDAPLAVVAHDGNAIEPFHALYSAACSDKLSAELKHLTLGRAGSVSRLPQKAASLSGFVSKLPRKEIPRGEVERFTPDWRLFFNFNTREDILSFE